MLRFLQEKFKVYERLYLHYLMYVGVEVTLSNRGPNKRLKLGKKVLYKLRTILLNTLIEFEEHEDINQKHLARQTQVYEHKSKVSYVTLQLDINRAKFILENGRDFFRHPKHDSAIKKQHERSLKKNLDLIILTVIYESITGKTLNMEELLNPPPKSEDQILPSFQVRLDSSEGLMKLYRLNQGLIKYLREEIIVTLQPIYTKHLGNMDKGTFKQTIKQKISKLIERYYVKHADTHERVSFYKSARVDWK